jgi:hypothetical protein
VSAGHRGTQDTNSPSRSSGPAGAGEDNQYLAELKSNPDVTALVDNYKYIFSSAPQSLNDSSSEYIVQTMKHFYDKIIVV